MALNRRVLSTVKFPYHLFSKKPISSNGASAGRRFVRIFWVQILSGWWRIKTTLVKVGLGDFCKSYPSYGKGWFHKPLSDCQFSRCELLVSGRVHLQSNSIFYCHLSSRWWFQRCFVFHRENRGRWTHFEQYFSKALKPPTSFVVLDGIASKKKRRFLPEIVYRISCLSLYLEGLRHPRWCRISSINSSFIPFP